ncbi:hypothetical protein CRX72_20580 [Pantoea sp. BRM17]|nr:hypothetical protein CRX72_20580 [Pantoea sp. BRM17]
MKHLPLLTVSLLASLIATSAVADVTTYNRAATGDLTQHGGARRLSSDQTEALKASLTTGSTGRYYRELAEKGQALFSPFFLSA